ncbi:MAG: sulfur carrier protein ThiS [Tannerella sp.]|jgi:sulfur carrier protein|nr:sulfur carrier protein ThiS [Tannerella sp.]
MGKIKVNGETQEAVFPLLLGDLLKQNQILQPEMVSVQINGEFVLRERFDSAAVSEGDEVDILYFMGGGR